MNRRLQKCALAKNIHTDVKFFKVHSITVSKKVLRIFIHESVQIKEYFRKCAFYNCNVLKNDDKVNDNEISTNNGELRLIFDSVKLIEFQ